jgi:hypothetical protein
MNWVVTIKTALLFFVLVPGVLVSLPPKGSKLVVAAFHAVVFAVVYHFTHKLVWSASMNLSLPKREGMDTPAPPAKKPAAPAPAAAPAN